MLNDEDKKFLELYSDSEYQKPSVTVDGVIFRIVSVQSLNYRKLPDKKLQVFLSKRRYSPFKDKFGVIGTFIDLNHELNETMKLCVKNKVNLQNYYFEQLFTFGEKSRDPRSRVLSVSYLLLTNSKEKLENPFPLSSENGWDISLQYNQFIARDSYSNPFIMYQTTYSIKKGDESVLIDVFSDTKRDSEAERAVRILIRTLEAKND